MRGQLVHINGMPLPPSLVDALEARRWHAPSDSVLKRVFKDDPVQPVFYDLSFMTEENARWCREEDVLYLGCPDLQVDPGDIDPKRSILIGDLGCDLLIALDYRKSASEPTVAYLGLREDGGWVQISENFDGFCRLLGMDR